MSLIWWSTYFSALEIKSFGFGSRVGDMALWDELNVCTRYGIFGLWTNFLQDVWFSPDSVYCNKVKILISWLFFKSLNLENLEIPEHPGAIHEIRNIPTNWLGIPKFDILRILGSRTSRFFVIFRISGFRYFGISIFRDFGISGSPP